MRMLPRACRERKKAKVNNMQQTAEQLAVQAAELASLQVRASHLRGLSSRS